MKKEFMSGLKAGFPIGLGYLSVSFSFSTPQKMFLFV